jgi:DNA polymerase elongation subunit (family B)
MSEAEAEEEKRRGALSPFTGRIVAIGVVNVDTGRSCAIYEVPGQQEVITRKDGDRTLISGNETQVLQKFWEYMRPEDRFISFNGRQFDGPFLMIRSAILGLQPTRDLVGKRFQFHPNCDLREVLNFQGTVNSRQMKFNLDLACKAFGVTSSKSDGMDGRAVEVMYRAGRYEDIATYCLEDVRATAELYQKLAPTIIIWEKDFKLAELMSHRGRAAHRADVEEAIVPSDEQPFLDSIAATSAQLSVSLDSEEAREELVMRHQAAVLETQVRDGNEPPQDVVVPPSEN